LPVNHYFEVNEETEMKKTILIVTVATLLSLAGCATKTRLYDATLTIVEVPTAEDIVTYKIENGTDCIITTGPFRSDEQRKMAALDAEARQCLEDVTGESSDGLKFDVSKIVSVRPTTE
jgi:hypothetical protein